MCDDWSSYNSTPRQPRKLWRGDNRGVGRGRDVSDRQSSWHSNNERRSWNNPPSYRDNRPFDRGNQASTSQQATQAPKTDPDDGWGGEWGADLGIVDEPQPKKQPPPQATNDDDDFDDWGTLAKESAENERKKWQQLDPIVKNFYIESPEVSALTVDQVNQFRRENNNITLSHLSEDDKRPLLNPVMKFEDAFAPYPEILTEISKYGFDKPTPIQAQSWPILLSGYDLIGIAQTGTGKTLAYLLPALIHIDGQMKPRKERPGPSALIIAPTRELAQQIEKEAAKYSYKGIRTVCLTGGADRSSQIATCEQGVEIVIATPGRLCDLTDHRRIILTSVSYLVLDEADRMLDMGFEPEIRKIMYNLNPNRQAVLMSATWPQSVRSLAQSYTQQPFQIYINTLDLTAVESVTQEIVVIDQADKPKYLEDFVRSLTPDDKAIVFFGRKVDVDAAVVDISIKGLIVQSMHGSRDQISREQALDDLKTGLANCLFATDVASRGLDVQDVTHILNYDFPRHIEEYVHRIGRTGRAGRSGKSTTLVTENDKKHCAELIEILERASQPVPDEVRDFARQHKLFVAQREAEREADRAAGRFSGIGGRGGRGFGGRGFGGRGPRF